MADGVQQHYDRVAVIRDWCPAAVILTRRSCRAQETLGLLGDATALAHIREEDEGYTRGDVLRGADGLCQRRP